MKTTILSLLCATLLLNSCGSNKPLTSFSAGSTTTTPTITTTGGGGETVLRGFLKPSESLPLEFGNILLSTYGDKTVTFTNSGQARISNIAWGAISQPFAYNNSSCLGRTSLGINESCFIVFRFSPALAVDTNVSMEIHYEDGVSTQNLNIGFKGTGVAIPVPSQTPVASVSPTPSPIVVVPTPSPTPSIPPVVVTPPVALLVASNNSPNYGDSVTLTWSSTNATNCTLTSSIMGQGPWQGLSGSTNTGALNASAQYILSCSGDGGTAQASVNFNITFVCPSNVVHTGLSIDSNSSIDTLIASGVMAGYKLQASGISGMIDPWVGNDQVDSDCRYGYSAEMTAQGRYVPLVRFRNASNQTIGQEYTLADLETGVIVPDGAVRVEGRYWDSDYASNSGSCRFTLTQKPTCAQ